MQNAPFQGLPDFDGFNGMTFVAEMPPAVRMPVRMWTSVVRRRALPELKKGSADRDWLLVLA